MNEQHQRTTWLNPPVFLKATEKAHMSTRNLHMAQ